MFQSFWSYALMMVLSIAPVFFLVKVLWASHSMAASASIRKMITYLVGFAALAVASVMILMWAFVSGLPLVSNLFTSNPATLALNDAGLRITGAIDSAVAGGISLPDVSGDGGGFTMPTLPGLPSGGFTMPSMMSLPLAPTAAPTAVQEPVVAPTVVTAPTVIAEMMEASTQAAPANNRDWAGYEVRPGDSMASIARRYGVSVGDLCGMNVSVTRGNCNLIKVGMTLKLPAAGGQAPRELVQVARPVVQMVVNNPVVIRPTPVPVVQQAVASGAQTYTIKAGDNIYKIAGKFGGMDKVYGICTANRATLGDNCDNMQIGAVIVVK